MKHYKIKAIALASLTLLGAASLTAQGLRSSYFMEGMTYRHQLNPAFMGESNYLNLPFFVFGNFNIGTQANIGVNDFIYKYNKNGSKLTTFMNPDISRNEFLSNLHDNNHLNMNLNLPILAFGFHGFGGFNTFAIGLRSNTSINLPYDLFDFMKTGMSNENGTHYNIKDLTIRSNNYAEVALGHSREIIKDRLTIGAKVKILVGGANANAHLNNMDLYLSQDKWEIQADGVVDGSLKGGYFTTKAPDKDGRLEVDGFDIDGPGIGGYGVGFDLGAIYKMDDFVEGLTLSAAITDLGFIKWNNGIQAKMQDHYTFEGFKDPKDGDSGDIDDQLNQFGKELEGFIKLYDNGKTNSRTTKLASNLNIGAEYALPVYKNLRFGLLSSTYFNKPFTWSEVRASANIAPVRWFEASVNYAIGSFGSSLGWVINFHPNGFNFFIGTDHVLTKVTPQGIPVGNANTSVNMGFNIIWGKTNKEKKVKPNALEEF